MTAEKRNDEIDLIEVFQKMGAGIKNLFIGFLDILYKILLFFIRRAILIAIIIVVTVAFGYFKYKTSERYHSSSLEAYSNAMASIDMINYVNNINELFSEKNIKGLETKLGIDSKELKKIKTVKAYKVIDINKDGVTDLVDYDENYNSSDTTISKSRFVIKVEVYDQAVFPVIQQSILNYIDQNKYIKDLNTIRKRQLHELIAKLNVEISSLDSLKKTEYFKKDKELKTQQGQLLVMNEKTTQLYHPQIIALYKEKQDLEQKLELRTDPITIIQDFSALSTVENNLMSYIKRYGLIGLVLSILISITAENFKGIKKYYLRFKKKIIL
jgi:NACalpha-BTF3-like transcription factor